jgi:hypothetical protein
MCDYSLMGVPNRLATEGEELVVHRFPTNSIGLASPRQLINATSSGCSRGRRFWSVLKDLFVSEMNKVEAVCIPPGATLFLRDIPSEIQRALQTEPAELVTFTQLTATPNAYRDAVRFKNGRELLLQELSEGQHVTIVDLAVVDEPVPATKTAAKASIPR